MVGVIKTTVKILLEQTLLELQKMRGGKVCQVVFGNIEVVSVTGNLEPNILYLITPQPLYFFQQSNPRLQARPGESSSQTKLDSYHF